MLIEELKIICDMTVSLVELRQNECIHLSIENYAPEIFGKLLTVFEENKTIVTMVKKCDDITKI